MVFLVNRVCSYVNIQFIALCVNSLGLKDTQNTNCSISCERSLDPHLWTNTQNIIFWKCQQMLFIEGTQGVCNGDNMY